MKEALKLALEALEYWDVHGGLHQPTEEAITALRLAIDVQNMASESTYKAALAQPAQEPENRCVRELREFAKLNQGTYIFPSWDGNRVLKYLGDTTTPQQEPWCMKMNGCKTKCEDCPVEVAQEERNFCSRCGKRTADLTVIHTCTPPQENT